MNNTQNKKKIISIVVPVYCEELGINQFIQRTLNVMKSISYDYHYELIFVNDGSTDKSLDLLKQAADNNPNIKIISLSKNFGHQIAITAGIHHSKGDAVITIDSDLQDPPEIIPEMIIKWRQGYDVVYGIRNKRKGETLFKLLSAKLYYRILNWLSDTHIPLDSGDFRLIDRKIAEIIKLLPEKNRYLRGLIPWTGYRQCGIEYSRDSRYAGETKYTYRKMVRLAFDGITGFSVKPIYMVFRMGIIISITSFLLILFYVLKKIFIPASLVHGWTSTIILIFFIGGIQLISIGIIGIYIGKIYSEVKARPLYLVSEKVGYDDDLKNEK